MKELSKYELCLLIYLCYKKQRYSRNDLKEESLNEHIEIWTRLKNNVNNYTNGIALSVEQTHIENHFPQLTYLAIQVKDKQLLCKFLDNYSRQYFDNTLKSYDCDRLSSHELQKRFKRDIGKFRISIDKSKVLNEYFIDDTKYIPIILWGLRNGHIEFKDIRFSLAPNKEQLDYIPSIDLHKRKLKNNVSDKIIDFCMTVDLSKFIQLRGLQKVEAEVRQDPDALDLEKPELETGEWKIFYCIYAEVKDINKEGIHLIDERCFTSRGVRINKTFEKDKSKLNTKVRRILMKTSKDFLIKPNKDDEHKYNINMPLYQEFLNEQENKFMDFITNYNAKKNLP